MAEWIMNWCPCFLLSWFYPLEFIHCSWYLNELYPISRCCCHPCTIKEAIKTPFLVLHYFYLQETEHFTACQYIKRVFLSNVGRIFLLQFHNIFNGNNFVCSILVMKKTELWLHYYWLSSASVVSIVKYISSDVTSCLFLINIVCDSLPDNSLAAKWYCFIRMCHTSIYCLIYHYSYLFSLFHILAFLF